MLRDPFAIFDGVSVPGALVLLLIGFLVGTSLHEYTVLGVSTVRGWYAGRHD